MTGSIKRIGLVMMVILVLVTLSSPSSADWSDPYFVSGHVTDADGDAVASAVVIVENLETGETNTHDSEGDAKTSPITIRTNSNGTYLFELLQLTEGFDDGDELKITATKSDENGSVIVTVDVSEAAGIRDADIELGVEADDDDDDTAVCGAAMILGLIGLVGVILKVHRRPREVPGVS